MRETILDQDAVDDAGRLSATIRTEAPAGVRATIDVADMPSYTVIPAAAPGTDGAGPTTPRPQPGAYQMLEQLGQGSMGVVYAVLDQALQRELAMKVYRLAQGEETDSAASVRDLFTTEALMTASLDHPNVVPIHTLGTDEEGRLFFTMKRVMGRCWADILHPENVQDLKQRDAVGLQAEGMNWRDHVNILLKVADAVAYAHSKGILHRDLKPENIMIGSFGEVFVMDWGIAFCFDERNPYRDDPDLRPQLAGTPYYMAPEMAASDMTALGPHSDVYQLGAILYEILTGKSPHQGPSFDDVLKKVVRGDIRPPEDVCHAPHVNRHISRIVMKALAYRRADRYPDVPAFQRDLRDYLDHAESLEISGRAGSALKEITREIWRAFPEGLSRGRPFATDRAAVLYLGVSQCIGSLRQAIALWDRNREARQLLADALSLHVNLALQQGDLTLARAQWSVLQEVGAEEEHSPIRESIAHRVDELGQRLRTAEEQAVRSARNLRFLRRAAVLLGALAAAGLLTVVGLLHRQRAVALRHGESTFATAVASHGRMVEEHFLRFDRLARQYRQEALRLVTLPEDLIPRRPRTPAGRDGFYLDEDYYASATRPPDVGTLPRYGQVMSLSHATVVRAPWAREGPAQQRAVSDARRLARLNTLFLQVHQAYPEVMWSLAGTRSGLLIGYPGSGRYRDKPDYDPTRRAWYVAAIDAETDDPVWGDPYADASTHQLIMSCMARIRVADDNVGVVGLEVSLKGLHGLLLGLETRSGDEQVRCVVIRPFVETDAAEGRDRVVHRVLIDTRGRTVAASWRERYDMLPLHEHDPVLAAYYRQAQQALREGKPALRKDGKMIAFSRMPRLGWTLIMETLSAYRGMTVPSESPRLTDR